MRVDFSWNLNPPIYPVTYDATKDINLAKPYVGEGAHFNFFFSLGHKLLMPIRAAQSAFRLRKSTQRHRRSDHMLASSALIPSAFVSLAQPAPDPAADTAQPLDRVIAVVNTQVILASDLDLEMRIVHLLPLDQSSSPSPKPRRSTASPPAP